MYKYKDIDSQDWKQYKKDIKQNVILTKTTDAEVFQFAS